MPGTLFRGHEYELICNFSVTYYVTSMKAVWLQIPNRVPAALSRRCYFYRSNPTREPTRPFYDSRDLSLRDTLRTFGTSHQSTPAEQRKTRNEGA